MSTRNMRQIVGAMDTVNAICRDLTHAWQPHTAERSGRGFKRTLLCSRCGTKRKDELTGRGAVRRRSYVYPDGYLVEGVGRLQGDTKNLVRLESLSRILNGQGDTTT